MEEEKEEEEEEEETEEQRDGGADFPLPPLAPTTFAPYSCTRMLLLLHHIASLHQFFLHQIASPL